MGRKKRQEQHVTISPYLQRTAPQESQATSQDGAGCEHDTQVPPTLDFSPSSSAGSSPPGTQIQSGQSTMYTDMGNAETQPVTAQILRGQLQQLRTDLTTTITQTVSAAVSHAMREIQRDLTDLGERTDKLETYTDDIAQRIANLEEENTILRDELIQVKDSCEDLENRSRRQNLHIRGVPEEIGATELREYIQALCSTLCPGMAAELWRLDRAHRSLGPRPPISKPPRDIGVRFHYYESKEAVLTATRAAKLIEFQGHKVQIYSDISPVTLAKRRELRPVTRLLQERKIPYRWGYPFKLIVARQGQTYILQNPNNSRKFLAALGIQMKNNSTPERNAPTKPQLQPIWNKVPTTNRGPNLTLSPSPPRAS
uniref:L1 transposable element RRM domain-containing protein n=1 Tax=Xenopus tropicalis TaxID=8364 RepID=A0A803J8S4_XENTR